MERITRRIVEEPIANRWGDRERRRGKGRPPRPKDPGATVREPVGRDRVTVYPTGGHPFDNPAIASASTTRTGVRRPTRPSRLQSSLGSQDSHRAEAPDFHGSSAQDPVAEYRERYARASRNFNSRNPALRAEHDRENAVGAMRAAGMTRQQIYTAMFNNRRALSPVDVDAIISRQPRRIA